MGLFFENEERRDSYQRKAGQMVPAYPLFEIEHGKSAEDDQRNDLLNGLELYRAKGGVTDAVGLHTMPPS